MSSRNEKNKATTTVTSVTSDAYTNICPDGHACDNDASCVESLLVENKFVCDCLDSLEETGRVYAGLSCQHVATDYCTKTGELSRVAFCTNQGTCKSKVNGPDDAHPGCDCPEHYTGEHCQYIAGSEPDEFSYFLDGTAYAGSLGLPLRNSEGPGVNPAAIVVPILFVTFGALGYVLYKYRNLRLKGHVVDKTKKADENQLNADGSTMDVSMKAIILAGRRNSTPAFSSTHKAALMDPPDFEDLLEQSDHVQFHMDPTGTATHKLFASDPTLNYTPTLDTTGSGSPAGYTEKYGFEEYDTSNDYGSATTTPTSTADSSASGTKSSPTFT